MAKPGKTMSPDISTSGDKRPPARILLVDDDAAVTDSLTSLLTLETDYEIIRCGSAPKAAQLLKETSVDLIITDFLMPEMNGLQLLAEAKRLHPEVPRILLTGYADKENAIRAINEVGLFQFVEKPWDNEHILLVIQNAITTKSLQETLTDRIRELDEVLLQRSRLQERDDFLREELRQARQLQQGMLPEALPSSNGLVTNAVYLPALDIGGDFYDAIQLADEQYALLVADATGHGIPAALCTAVLKFAFTQFSRRPVGATEIVRGMNKVLHHALPSGTFVAGAVAVVDPSAPSCTFVNAGLPHPYWVRRGTNTAEAVGAEGFMLGVLEDEMYEPAEEVTVSLQSGDMLLFYTDGLSEVENGGGEQFDTRRLHEVLCERMGDSCEEVCNALVQSSREFGRPDHTWDDVTILGIGLR
ncbi:MAG: SpoIIE family protein phosphatase [Candidatus Latescibacterota bacterium]|nr:MAG: SpoIIE family protein phosphatase [Candidatus Latescibacterota bacterium]